MEMMDVEDLFGGGSRPASRASIDRYDDDRENDSPAEEPDDDDERNDEEQPRFDLDQGDAAAGAAPTDTQAAQLELDKKKKVVRNPQPKLDPDRICGKRGVKVLEEIFQDFKPKGKGHEYDDLDVVLKKMEHWAHRLYPRLPFDDVMERISEVGKKAMVKTHVRKLRLGMISANSAREEEMMEIVDREQDQEEDAAKRYEDDFPDEDIFGKLVREAEERQLREDEEVVRPFSPVFTRRSSRPPSPDEDDLPPSTLPKDSADQTTASPASTQEVARPSSISEEQREKILRNKQLAAERRRIALEQSQQSQESSSQPEARKLPDWMV